LFQLVKRERRAVGELIGYCDRISASAGDTLDVMVHTDQAEYEASVVRLIHGDRNPAGPGFREEEVAGIPAVRRPGREQVTHTGSYALIADCPALGRLGSLTAVDREGFAEGVCCLSVPIMSSGTAVPSIAISVTTPSHRFDQAWPAHLRSLQEMRSELESALAHT
jgi:hypothetical protein